MDDFKFFNHTLALSVGDAGPDGQVPCDLLLAGDLDKVQDALIAQMDRHPMLASLICCAGYNYLRKLALGPTGDKNMFQ